MVSAKEADRAEACTGAVGACPLEAAAPARAVAAECGAGVATVVVPPADVVLPYLLTSALQHQCGVSQQVRKRTENVDEKKVMFDPSFPLGKLSLGKLPLGHSHRMWLFPTGQLGANTTLVPRTFFSLASTHLLSSNPCSCILAEIFAC